MVSRKRNVGVLWVVMLIGCFVFASTAALAADAKPAKPAAAAKEVKKAVDKAAETTDASKKTEKAEKKACDATKAEKKDQAATAKKTETKKTEAEKPTTEKPKQEKQEKKESVLSKLMGKAAGEKILGGAVKIEVKTGTLDKKMEAKKTEPAKKTPQVVRLKLAGSYPEGPESPPSPFGASQRSLRSLVAKLKELAEDKDVAAVILEIQDAELGSGKVHEVREAIARYRAGGKPIYAMLTGAEGGSYLVASACDEVLMAPCGVLMIPGVRAEVTFYKGLLDKIGVQFEVLQMGKYKGAGEPYSRTKMSEPLRESLESVVDDRYEWMVAAMAKDRNKKDYEVKTLIDRAVFTADAAKKAGLVDEVVYADVFLKQLPKKLKVDKVDVVSAYKSRRAEIDLSGISGMMKLFQMMLGGEKPAVKTTGKKIALVYAVGMIMEGKSSESLFGEQVLGSTTLVEALKTAAEDPQVAAVVLRIDSPGGSAIASDLIWRETVQMDKPIIASMGDVAGSGGYYIAMGADKVFAEPGTLTGSIGVIGGKFVTGGLYKKLGLSTEVISRGKNNGAFSSNAPFTPEQREAMVDLLQSIYRQFVSKAAKGRKMSYAKLHELAQGRVYSGQSALKLGLIDRLGTLDDAVAEAKKAAGIKADEKVELLVLPKPRSFFDQLFEDPSASTGDALARVAGSLGKVAAQTAVFERLFREPTLFWMPYSITVR